MQLKQYYWYFKSALSSKFCDDVIKHGIAQKERMGLIGGVENKIKKRMENQSAVDHLSEEYLKTLSLEPTEIEDLKKKRDSNIAWLEDKWIYNEIHPFIHEANKNAGWNFQWDYSESCQFTKYKLDQYYDWHCDSFIDPYEDRNNVNFHGKIRKLSVTCSLSDPKDYEGGQLEFQFRNNDDPMKTKICKEILPKGSIVVFPSFVYHRVKPVTKGTRYSLVIWNLGYPFK